MSKIEILSVIAIVLGIILIELVRNPKNNPYYRMLVMLLLITEAFILGFILTQFL
ncbi:hypothetical protein [Aneurinibacillus danicus]|uniref:Uncharacterized protein n=1 Tax=Aneurinibacillus danicus TaxID=267746 RepID=A0A511VAU4_9BACL|nr:hypothetical protein [Aneurinibacillus danicus]GEN35939.1 hypothetical protein ADA01nite_33990 [Aneurinibacillus danicus]